MSLPKYCLDIGRNRLKCSCSVPPPTFNVPLPPIPTKEDDQMSVDEHEPEIITTEVPFADTTSNSLPDPKVLGTVFGIIFVIVILILIGLYYFRKRQGPGIGLDELAQGADRSKLKLSPSSCSQKPLLQSSSAPSENPINHNPQQSNGESVKMMEISENTPKVDTINDASFTGGDHDIPMIDDEDIDPELVSRVIFNESTC